MRVFHTHSDESPSTHIIRFQQFPVDESIGAHEYWLRIFDSSGVGGSAGSALQHSLGQDLARMGLEISSIPAMSTEAERIFSG